MKSLIFKGCGHPGVRNSQNPLKNLATTLGNPWNSPWDLPLTLSFLSADRCREPIENTEAFKDSGGTRQKEHKMSFTTSQPVPWPPTFLFALGSEQKISLHCISFSEFFVPVNNLFWLIQKLVSNNSRIILWCIKRLLFSSFFCSFFLFLIIQ